jgi:hypothetical protein
MNEVKTIDGGRVHFISAEVEVGDEAEVVVTSLDLGESAPSMLVCQPRLDDGAVSRRASHVFATTVLETTKEQIRFLARRLPEADGDAEKVRFDIMAAE